MTNYSPEFIAAMRHDYEETDLSLAQIAAKHDVSERTVNRMRDRYGWARRSARVRDVAPAVVALQEATRLLVAREAPRTPDPGIVACDGAAGSPPPERGRSASEASRVGVNDRAAMRPPPQPSPSRGPHGASAMGTPQGEGADRPSRTTCDQNERATAIERIERLLERELEAEEAARKALGVLPRPPADAERCARTLATLTQTLHALARLRGGLAPDNGLADDDMPRDIDEFRRELARRIRVFVQNRIAGRVGGGVAAGADSTGKP